MGVAITGILWIEVGVLHSRAGLDALALTHNTSLGVFMKHTQAWTLDVPTSLEIPTLAQTRGFHSTRQPPLVKWG